MVCKIIPSGIVCGSFNRAAPCAYCKNRHTRLCDFVTGKPVFGKPNSGRTCDKPMCGEHTWWDGTKDFCRDHATPA